jgi:transglutaminase-like putative cysteine protease
MRWITASARAAAVAASLLAPAWARAPLPAGAAPPSGERWFVVRIAGTTVGTASERWTPGADDVVFEAQMNVRFTRMGTPLAMNVLTEEVCDPRGRLLRARMESSVSNLGARAALEGDSLHYESSAGGTVRRSVVAWPPEAVPEMAARSLVRAWLAGTAPETTCTLFDVSDGTFRRQRLVRGERSEATVAGVTRAVVAVDEYDEGESSPTSTTWYEADGAREAVRTVVRQLGVEIEIAHVSAAELAAIEIEPGFDIIRRSMVPCPGFPPVSGAAQVDLEIEFPAHLPEGSMDGPNQVETGRDGRIVRLRLTRETAVRETTEPAQLEPFLHPDRFIQSDAPELRAVADSLRAATGAKGWPLARATAAWVDGHIARKGMEHGYASALDVYRTRAGDCTEHSLLTVAVLRAAGIPARPVVGLMYGEAEGAFVGHMWVEVYADYWRTLDALNLALDPVRVRIHAPASGGSMGERELMRAYATMSGVRIRATGNGR